MGKHGINEELKQLIVDTGVEMVNTGMTVGTWGNLSVRDPETGLVYMSPSGMDYVKIRSEHVVVMTTDLELVDGTAEPSIEKNMHAAVYRHRDDVHAVVHTHPIYSSVFGVIREELPAVSEDFAQIVGEKVQVAEPYQLPGTPELGKVASETLGQYNAVLLPNHGALSVGPDMHFALKVANVLEKNAQIYIYSRMLGEPSLFSREDIDAMQSFARTQYGKKNRELVQ